ncbi:major facilitator superfamily domain-containing protein [Chaetomium sp. MPI-CAGE-AT-0009]|nr:major facilitator superfamily domain-containing protein [Chaetomium sp. MPI-CAGE-AT-0009]
MIEGEPLLAGEERDSFDIDETQTLTGAATATPSTTASETDRAHQAHAYQQHGQRGIRGIRGFAARFQARKRKTVVALLAVLMFSITTSGMLFLIPIFRLMEDAVCHVHYDKPRSEPIEERLCKVDGVQKELAFLGGIGAVINCVVGLLSTLPYGVLADRATSFLTLSFGAVAGGLIGPITAGLLMEHMGPWFPVSLVFCITPFVFILVLFLPETLPIKLQDASQPEETRSLAQKLRQEAKELGVSFSLLKNRDIALSLPAFLIQPALFAAYSSTLSQHISTYFGWSLAQTSYLLSPLGILQLIIIALLPFLSGFLTKETGRFRLSIFSKDLLLTRISLLLLITGAVIEGFSREIVLFLVGLTVGNIGSSHGPLCRAIATSYVEPQQTSRLYALISMLETGGAMLGGPVLAWCFNIGLSKKGMWTGLPWFYVAGLVLVALVSLTFLRAPKPRAVVPDPEEEEENGDLGYLSADEQV